MHKAARLSPLGALMFAEHNWPERVAVDTGMNCEEPGIGSWEGSNRESLNAGKPARRGWRKRDWEKGHFNYHIWHSSIIQTLRGLVRAPWAQDKVILKHY